MNEDEYTTTKKAFTTTVSEALEALGDSVEAVGSKLEELGIKGSHSALHCPVANYLKTKGIENPWVNKYRTTGGGLLNGTEHVEFVQDHPRVVTAFIEAFDAGKFSALEQSNLYYPKLKY